MPSDAEASLVLDADLELGGAPLPIPAGATVTISGQPTTSTRMRRRGRRAMSSEGLPPATTLNAAGLSRHFEINGTLRLERVHLTGGRAVSGGSLLVRSGGSLELVDSVISGAVATGTTPASYGSAEAPPRGGGIAIEGVGTALLRNSRIEGCHVHAIRSAGPEDHHLEVKYLAGGGAIYKAGTANLSMANVTIAACAVELEDAVFGAGGALLLGVFDMGDGLAGLGTTVVGDTMIESCFVRANVGVNTGLLIGGGIAVLDYQTLSMVRGTVRNTSVISHRQRHPSVSMQYDHYGGGGGVWATHRVHTSLVDSEVTGCSISTLVGGATGGGLAFMSGEPVPSGMLEISNSLVRTRVDGCSVRSVRDNADGGGLSVQSVVTLSEVLVTACTATAVEVPASGRGGGLFASSITANLLMTSLTLVAANTASGSGQNIMPVAGKSIYQLPAPSGRYISAKQCTVERDACPSNFFGKPADQCAATESQCALDAGASAVVGATTCQPLASVQAICPWQASPSLLGSWIELLPLSRPIDEDYPYGCQPGRLGSANEAEQRDARCAGSCPAGSYCEQPMTLTPAACTPGHVCPLGSSLPRPCDAGRFSSAIGLHSSTQCPSCPEGHFCTTGTAVPEVCSAGSYSTGGQLECTNCAAGTFQGHSNQTGCEPCPVGHYCLDRATMAVPCPAGTKGNRSGLRSADECAPCAVGSYCPAGSAEETPCPAGRYGDEPGLQTAECSGAAAEGYYTPEGSTHPETVACAAGRYNQFKGGSSADNCVPCPLNTYTPLREANTGCYECFVGGVTRAPGASSEAQCECIEGKYRDGRACFPCLQGTTCAQGTFLATLHLDSGRWRTSNRSTDIEHCTGELACIGGNDTTDQCQVGYSGPLCAVCDRAKGYRKVAGGECVQCEATAIDAREVVPLLVLLALSVALLAMCVRQLRKQKKGAPAQRRRYKEPPKDRVRRILSQVTVKLKIVIANQQVFRGIGAVYDIQWPPELLRVLSYASILDLDVLQILPLGCVVHITFIHSLVATTVVPLVVVILLGVGGMRARRAGREALGYVLFNAAFLLAFLGYPAITRKVFSFFITKEFDADYGTFLKADYSINVATAQYTRWLPFALCMLVWPFGVPLVVAALLFYNREPLLELRRRDIESRIPAHLRPPARDNAPEPVVEGILWSLTESYKPTAFYFELYEYLIQKLALVGLAVFFPDPGSYQQLVLGIIICFLYAILLVYYRPYSSAADNVLALLSQLALYVSMLQSILVKSATGEIPTDVTAILIVCAVTPSVLLIAVSVQIVFNELQVDPVGQVAEKAKTRVSQVGARLSTRRASSHASSHASSTALNHTDGWKWNRVQAPALDAAGLPIAPPGSRKLGTVVV